MANTYIEVPRERIEALLAKSGFAPGRAGNELTYSITHRVDPRLSVTVYTSVALDASDARGCGEDAIRVIAQFTWLHRASNETRRKNLFKARIYRVNSVDGVLDRMLAKMREAYAACNEYTKRGVVIVEP